MATDIREIPIGGDLRHFLEVADPVYHDDPNYVQPLDLDLKDRLGHKNPYFQHAEGTIFVALRDGKCVGRVVAHKNRAHLERYNDGVGFFGFLDTIDDSEICSALLDRARAWLKARGLTKMRGPVSLTMADEVGCLVDGFDTPPMVLMPHNRPYQSKLIEQAGLNKAMDCFAWRYEVGTISERARKAHEEISSMPEVRCRNVEMKHIERDVELMLDMYNDAWDESWGYVPLTPAEARKILADLKLIIMPELAYIVEIDGEPAAFAYAIPNVNEMIADLHGKLGILGLPKLLYRLKVKGPKTARLVGLGIRKKFRHMKRYGALSMFLYVKMNRSGAANGIKWGELSYTLESNKPVSLGIRAMGGKIYKTYRIYERAV